MTTADDFTEAARAYAEGWNRHAEESFNRGQEGAHGVDEESLIAGAEWARTRLAMQEKSVLMAPRGQEEAMTVIYVPTPVTSVEQAEELPEGTVVLWIDPDGKYGPTLYTPNYDGEYATANEDRYPLTAADLPVTALMPIEAEEEREEAGGVSIAHGTTHTWPARTRLVTPWEDA